MSCRRAVRWAMRQERRASRKSWKPRAKRSKPPVKVLDLGIRDF
jgi:hypothetical protein